MINSLKGTIKTSWFRARAIELEKNGSHYPEMTLSNFKRHSKPLTLEEVDKKLGTSLYDFEEETAEECSGSCMTWGAKNEWRKGV